MITVFISASLVTGAYILGSIPSGLLVARTRGVDIRNVGSRNIGATNVSRNLGKRLGAVVLVIDALKGAVPAAIAMLLTRTGHADSWLVFATGMAAICGHCFPMWLRFRGGKGVATTLGVMLVVAPIVTLFAIAVFLGLYAASRIVSIGSLGAACSCAIVLIVTGAPIEHVTLAATTALLIVIQHRDNIHRLRKRQEYRV